MRGRYAAPLLLGWALVLLTPRAGLPGAISGLAPTLSRWPHLGWGFVQAPRGAWPAGEDLLLEGLPLDALFAFLPPTLAAWTSALFWLLVGGAGAWWLGRRWWRSEGAALASAVVWLSGGSLAAALEQGQLNQLASLGLLPWAMGLLLVGGAPQAALAGGLAAAMALATPSLALTLLAGLLPAITLGAMAGQPQLRRLVFALAGAWLLALLPLGWMLASGPFQGLPLPAGVPGLGVLAGALGLLLARHRASRWEQPLVLALVGLGLSATRVAPGLPLLELSGALLAGAVPGLLPPALAGLLPPALSSRRLPPWALALALPLLWLHPGRPLAVSPLPELAPGVGPLVELPLGRAETTLRASLAGRPLLTRGSGEPITSAMLGRSAGLGALDRASRGAIPQREELLQLRELGVRQLVVDLNSPEAQDWQDLLEPALGAPERGERWAIFRLP